MKKHIMCRCAAALFDAHLPTYGWHRRQEAVTAPRFMGLGLLAACGESFISSGANPSIKNPSFKKLRSCDTYFKLSHH